jgi:hypothetical protein
MAVGAYSSTQARQTIRSGLRRGVQEPRQIPARPRRTTSSARPTAVSTLKNRPAHQLVDQGEHNR